jgi:hypothetical protein
MLDRLPRKERCSLCGTLTYLRIELYPNQMFLICPTCNEHEKVVRLDERLRPYVPHTWLCVSTKSF